MPKKFISINILQAASQNSEPSQCFICKKSLVSHNGNKAFHLLKNDYCSLWFKDAPINSRNNGCGRFGLEINSGWNCDATNHG